MRKAKALALLVLMVSLLACLGRGGGGGGASRIRPGDVAGAPDPPMTVAQEPNPLLLGHWGCTHVTTVLKTGEKFNEPIEYWLVKKGDQYGLYFYRHKRGGEKRYRGWRAWTINGDRIVSEVGVTIFVKDGEVYYDWKSDPPTRMTRLD
ncbi:MAG: hypothetical protein MUC41_16475 [Syntrophobacteraceae bacterium]|nr:hypothetical protein [Syntrophobacteraceae bacterium]